MSEMNENKEKKKKQKVVYVDDGRTISDMSSVGGTRFAKTPSRSSFKARWNTYWAAVRMMILPMLTVVLALGIIYLIMSILFWLM